MHIVLSIEEQFGLIIQKKDISERVLGVFLSFDQTFTFNIKLQTAAVDQNHNFTLISDKFKSFFRQFHLSNFLMTIDQQKGAAVGYCRVSQQQNLLLLEENSVTDDQILPDVDDDGFLAIEVELDMQHFLAQIETAGHEDGGDIGSLVESNSGDLEVGGARNELLIVLKDIVLSEGRSTKTRLEPET